MPGLVFWKNGIYMKNIFCKFCGAVNTENSIYCTQCGKKTGISKSLPDCKENEKYSDIDGKKLKSQKSTFFILILYLKKNYVAVLVFCVLVISATIFFQFVLENQKTIKKKPPAQAMNDINYNNKKTTELCDRVNVLRECNRYLQANDPRACLNLSNRFLDACGEHDDIHIYRNTAARRLSEWDLAIDSASKLITLYPYNANSYFMRAQTYQEKGDLQHSIIDYEQVLAVMPAEIQSPFHLATLYQRIGQPCMGIGPLESFLYHHSDISTNAEEILSTLHQKPECRYLDGNGTAKIIVNKNGTEVASKVLINGGYKANFLVDTGASYVTLSKNLADKMKLQYSNWPILLMQTANGVKEGHSGFVDEIALQDVKARHVAVVVSDGLGSIDGLLGMSFLSRFKVELDMQNGYVTLQGRTW